MAYIIPDNNQKRKGESRSRLTRDIVLLVWSLAILQPFGTIPNYQDDSGESN